MKNKIPFIPLLFLLLIFTAQNYGQKVGKSYILDVNKLKLPIDNEGKMDSGICDSLSFLFSSGFLISGQDGDLLWTNASKTFVNHFTPGTYNIDSSDSRSVLYRVRKDDPPFGQSWQEWSGAVQLGAYFYDGNGDHIYNPVDLNGNNQWDPDEDKPDIPGDETLWCAYNDSHPGGIYNLWQSVPMGIEIKQTIFAFSINETPLSNVIFVRYRIINNGSVRDTLKNVIFSNFPDADLGANHYDDYGATDTLRNAIITYNDAFDDSGGFGADPPAFLLAMLNGPYSYIPGVSFNDVNGNGNYDEGIDIPLDTAISYLGELGINIIPGASNLNISAATHYSRAYPGEGDPRDSMQARNLMQGQKRDGQYPDPCTYLNGEVRGGVNCADVNPVFWYSGDPVTDEGWIHTTVGDVRSIMSTGYLTLIKNKPVNILYGYIVGRGTDNLNSITVGRAYLDEIQNLVNNNFGYPMIVSVKDDKNKLPENFALYQNYPNPFNSSSSIQYFIPKSSQVILKIFNTLGEEIETLVNEEKPAGTYELTWNANNLSSGVYFYRIKAGSFIQTKKMILLK